ncbi:hypothetical protein Dsin_001717 [Dipteronia sinensis]|uniref:RNase H type-1 domain-containing protein n=1 Tax=Dipteronia sinensis TaxID=43782 RepID=A0AAE0EIQ4_9ROSI|nr:hypothetical protein Dsin_001717 [Dipteronia sinensis]
MLRSLRCEDNVLFQDFFFSCINSLKIEELALLGVLCWRIWYLRNQVVQHLKSNGLENILEWCSTTQRIEATYVPEIAEAVAMLRGITLAVDTGLVPTIVESDCLNLVRKVVDGVPTDGDIGLVVNDILHYFRNRAVSSVSYVPRKANKVAHSLVKMALAIAEDRFWLEEVPPSVELIVLEDVPD